MKKVSMLTSCAIMSAIIFSLLFAFQFPMDSQNNPQKEIEVKDITTIRLEAIESTKLLSPTIKPTPKIEKEFLIVEEKEEEKAELKKPEKSYSEEDLYVLSHVIYAEAGCCSREIQIGVGSVVLNRVKDERYPNTIKEVVFQKGQYACTWDGNYEKEPSQEAIDVAVYLLENGSQFPEYVIFQSSVKQGDSTYKQLDNVYFCYWSKDVK